MSEPKKKLRPGPDVPDRPQPGPADRPGTAEQLRSDIDRGRTRDKVDFPDPAAAPLGTDAEAGGTPTSAEALAAERRRSLDQPLDRPQEERRKPSLALWLGGLLVAALLVASLAVLFGS